MEGVSTPYRFSIEQFMRMGELSIFDPDDRVELVNGAIIELPRISSRHMSGVIRVQRLLNRLLGESVVISAQNPVVLGNSQPQPDIAVLRDRDDLYDDEVPDAADCLLLVEVSDSTGLFDRNVKGRLYARGGIAEYWIVDVGSGSVVVHLSPRGDGYDDVREYAGDGSWMSPALGGREIRVDDVLRRRDN
jgi:Uma2 family endonuclease